MAQTYKTPLIAPLITSGAIDFRNTPFSVPSYKVVLDTEVHPPGAVPGAFVFQNRWKLTSELKHVKFIKLLWAIVPNATSSDETITIRANWHGTFGSAFPPRHGNNTSSQFLDETEGAFAVLPNQVAGAVLGTNNFFQGEDFHVVQYFPQPIDLNVIELTFFNSHGDELEYGQVGEPIKVVLCLEVYCSNKE